jgi:hypothetical protein
MRVNRIPSRDFADAAHRNVTTDTFDMSVLRMHALNMGEWSASRPGRALAPEKGPYVPIVQEAGWAPEPV